MRKGERGLVVHRSEAGRGQDGGGPPGGHRGAHPQVHRGAAWVARTQGAG